MTLADPDKIGTEAIERLVQSGGWWRVSGGCQELMRDLGWPHLYCAGYTPPGDWRGWTTEAYGDTAAVALWNLVGQLDEWNRWGLNGG